MQDVVPRFLVVALALCPIIAALFAFPHPTVSTSLRAGAPASPAAVALGWWASCAVEWQALRWSAGLCTAPLFTLIVVTVGYDLDAQGGVCDALCVTHYVAVGAWGLAELYALYHRGCPPLLLCLLFGQGVAFSVLYLVSFNGNWVLAEGGRKAGGSLQVSILLAARAIPACLPVHTDRKDDATQEKLPLCTLRVHVAHGRAERVPSPIRGRMRR